MKKINNYSGLEFNAKVIDSERDKKRCKNNER